MMMMMQGNTANYARDANCEVQFHEHTMKINKIEVSIKIPMVVNSQKFEKRCELIVLSSKKPECVEEPATKKQKVGKGKGKAKK